MLARASSELPSVLHTYTIFWKVCLITFCDFTWFSNYSPPSTESHTCLYTHSITDHLNFGTSTLGTVNFIAKRQKPKVSCSAQFFFFLFFFAYLHYQSFTWLASWVTTILQIKILQILCLKLPSFTKDQV